MNIGDRKLEMGTVISYWMKGFWIKGFWIDLVTNHQGLRIKD
jgi:hypothetical protein